MPVSRSSGHQPMVGLQNNKPLNLDLPATIPGTTPKAPPSSNLPNLGGDSWEIGGAKRTELSPAVREKADAAVNKFASRLRRIMNHDAMSLAEGRSPVRAGDSLTENQQQQLASAAKDMMMNMPIGALSPQKTRELRSYLQGEGISTDNLETKTLKDLGKVGGDLAKQWASELKSDNPAVYYGLLGASSVAIGAYGFLQGSEALKKLGIKPQVKTKLFSNHVSLKTEAMWDKRFSNPSLATSIEGNYRAGDLRLRSNLTVDTRNLDEVTGGVGARWGSDKTYVDAAVNGNKNGVDSVVLSGRYTGANYTVSGVATMNDNLDLSTIDANYAYNGDDFYVRGRARADLINNNNSVEVRAGYQPTDNLDFGVRGGYSKEKGANVGVGVTWRF